MQSNSVVSSYPSHREVNSIKHYVITFVSDLHWAGLWYSSGTLVSFTNKTDRHGITEIVLKVALKHLIPNPNFKGFGVSYVNHYPLCHTTGWRHKKYLSRRMMSLMVVKHKPSHSFSCSTNLISQMSPVDKEVLWQRFIVYQLYIHHVSFFNYTKVFFKTNHTI